MALLPAIQTQGTDITSCAWGPALTKLLLYRILNNQCSARVWGSGNIPLFGSLFLVELVENQPPFRGRQGVEEGEGGAPRKVRGFQLLLQGEQLPSCQTGIPQQASSCWFPNENTGHENQPSDSLTYR